MCPGRPRAGKPTYARSLYLPFRDRRWPQCPARAGSFAPTIPRDPLADVAVAWIMELTVTWRPFYGRNRPPRGAGPAGPPGPSARRRAFLPADRPGPGRL